MTRLAPVPESIYGMAADVVIIYEPISAGAVMVNVYYFVETFQLIQVGALIEDPALVNALV